MSRPSHKAWRVVTGNHFYQGGKQKTEREARQEKGEGGVSGREKEGGGFWERMSSI